MPTNQNFDRVVFGAGIYGLHATLLLLEKGYKVALVEKEKDAFQRASYINQARLHFGYHYPRSVSTAKHTAKYFRRFKDDFNFAINGKFKKIYSISSRISYTSARQYLKFCDYVGIPAVEIDKSNYFNPGAIDSAYETEEYSFDAIKIKEHLLEKIKSHKNSKIFFNMDFKSVKKEAGNYIMNFADGSSIASPFVLNSTYAAINQIMEKFGSPKYDLKYEICEMIMCKASKQFESLGITVMDGPFLSVMPFGFSGYHTLSSVSYTPRKTSFEALPTFDCQQINTKCNPQNLDNCNTCQAKPSTSWKYMIQLTRKYLLPKLSLKYEKSLYAIKPILLSSEIDDSRPTIIRKFSNNPVFMSVLSGKINGIYELGDVLK